MPTPYYCKQWEPLTTFNLCRCEVTMVVKSSIPVLGEQNNPIISVVLPVNSET